MLPLLQLALSPATTVVALATFTAPCVELILQSTASVHAVVAAGPTAIHSSIRCPAPSAPPWFLLLLLAVA